MKLMEIAYEMAREYNLRYKNTNELRFIIIYYR
jgi:hypothetical protein